MTFKSLFSTLIVLWVLLAVIKFAFFRFFNLDALLLKIIFGALVFAVSEILTRRLGTLNFLEAMLVSGLYAITYFALDFIVLSYIFGTTIYASGMYWISYFLLVISIFFFHKKRHVEIRKQLHQQHGHH